MGQHAQQILRGYWQVASLTSESWISPSSRILINSSQNEPEPENENKQQTTNNNQQTTKNKGVQSS
jgi:hypothetical protein